MTDDECIHGLAPATCSLCLPPKPKPRATRTISARFDGRCPECGRPVDAGATIGLVGDDWLCARCYVI